MEKNKEFYISPNLENDDLTETINCINEAGENIELPVVKEIPLTIYLNKQEIVTELEELKFDRINSSFDYLLSMQIQTLTKEKYEQLVNEVKEKSAELVTVKKTAPIDMYRTDLAELKKNLKTK